MKNFGGLIFLVLFLAAIAFLNFGIALFVYCLLIVIMIHELGHLTAAKVFGFKAPQYFLGFGPTIWSTHKGETEYGVKAIPAGGFVKILGMSPYEEIAPEDEARSYPNKPAWQRAILLVAGSATHWVVAFVLLLVVAMGFGFPGPPTNQIAQVVQEVDGVETAAARSDLRPGDAIVALDGEETDSWSDTVAYIEARADETGSFTVLRDGERIVLDIEIVEAIVGDEGPVQVAAPGGSVRAPREGESVQGFLGVSPMISTDRAGPWEAIKFAGSSVGSFTAQAVTSLDDLFVPVFNGDLWRSLSEEGERDPTGPVGLVGAGRVVGQAADAGYYGDVLSFIAGITIVIGLMNLLPLPPLDGGHLLVLLIEKVRGKPVDVRSVIPVAAVVIAFFLVLFVAVLYLDLARPIKTPF